MYMSPIGDLLREHGISHHFLNSNICVFQRSRLEKRDLREQCVRSVKTWMFMNDLKLNDEKTEVILIGSKHFRSKLSDFGITVGDNKVCSVSSVQNLGVLFYQTLFMEQFVLKKVPNSNIES